MIGFWFGIGVILTPKMASNEVNATKAEKPVQVTMKDPEKFAAGRELAEFNHRKKEELVQKAKAKEYETKLSYGVGCYIYQRCSPGNNKVTPVRFVET